MAINCPKCKSRTPLSAEEAGPAGRFVSCPRCGTTWLARHFEANPHYGRASLPAPQQPLIIEGELAAPARPEPTRPEPPRATAPHPLRATATGFRPVPPRPARHVGGIGATGLAGAAMLGAALVAVVLLTPAVSALPWLGGSAAGPVALRAVESRTLTLRGSDALLVEGQLYNSGTSEAEVPGVRIALCSADAEVYSWVVEPSRLKVGPGGAIGFRSALADPPAGIDRISVTLAARGVGTGAR